MTRPGDSPWERLPWLLPLAFLVTMLSQAGLLALLRQAPHPSNTSRPLDVQIVEVPVAARPAEAPAPPAPRRPAAPPAPRRPAAPPARPLPERSSSSPSAPPVPTPAEPPSDPRSSGESNPAPEPATPSTSPTAPPSTPPSVGQAPPTQPSTAPAPLSPRTTGAPGGTDTMSARAIYKPMPEIPESLRRRAIEVVAVARFRVNAAGGAEVDLAAPTSDPDLNRVLLETLRRWRFFPAMKSGKPIASVIDIRIPISVK